MKISKKVIDITKAERIENKNEWIPIHETPKNGEWTLVWYPQIPRMNVERYWESDGWVANMATPWGKPSHYRKLPSLPKE